MSAAASGAIAGAGLLTSTFGAMFSARAADLARKRLLAVANTPGIDTRATTASALENMGYALPAASRLGGQINTINAAEYNRMLESAIPGYAAGVGKTMGNIEDYLSGVLPTDVSQAVMRATAGTAIGRGLGSGTPLAKALTWRDLGRTSEAGIRYGMESMMRVPGAFQHAQPVDIRGWLGLDPIQEANLRSTERAQKMQLMAQLAGMPGMTGSFGNTMVQVGGAMMGAGMGGMMDGGGGGGSVSTGLPSAASVYNPSLIQNPYANTRFGVGYVNTGY